MSHDALFDLAAVAAHAFRDAFAARIGTTRPPRPLQPHVGDYAADIGPIPGSRLCRGRHVACTLSTEDYVSRERGHFWICLGEGHTGAYVVTASVTGFGLTAWSAGELETPAAGVPDAAASLGERAAERAIAEAYDAQFGWWGPDRARACAPRPWRRPDSARMPRRDDDGMLA